MHSRTISILGCGWLGLPLARRLLKEGFQVKGSCTSSQKVDDLTRYGIKAYVLEYWTQRQGDISDFFRSDTLFLNIPFSRKLEDPRFYLQQIRSVINDARSGGIKGIIFTSSTAVYDDSLRDAREDALFIPRTERQRVLYEIEQSLLNDRSFKATVLRLGGLVGPGRPVGKFLAGKKDLKDPQKPVNLVHLDDCLQIITLIIKKGIKNDVFNVVCDEHPRREELYTQAARALLLPLPHFIAEERQGPYKIVPNKRLKERLGYQFYYPDPMGFSDE